MKKIACFFDKLADKKVKCRLCSHNCNISAGKSGLCGVRKNYGGELYIMTYGDIIAASPDPIEKKPIYHFLPGTISYSIAMIGCNFRCSFCQNWQISQVVGKDLDYYRVNSIMPEKIVETAVLQGAKSISYTYTEPTIFFEYAYDIAKIASAKNIKNIFVTNGYISAVALNKISPYLNAANVDLKYFNDESYRKICGGHLQPVLDTIKKMKELNIWIEVTTLIIPNENDSNEELRNIAEFIASIDISIPWHISAFFPQYKCNDIQSTPTATIVRAQKIGLNAGLKYIYSGNISI